MSNLYLANVHFLDHFNLGKRTYGLFVKSIDCPPYCIGIQTTQAPICELLVIFAS
jgi:hypothetical protein